MCVFLHVHGLIFHTVWLLNVSMTLSPPSRLSNTISAIMMGCVLTSRHEMTRPPTGVTALSMSAAVVPGAKFWAMTTNGPASPRIERPCDGAFGAFGTVTAPEPLLRCSAVSTC